MSRRGGRHFTRFDRSLSALVDMLGTEFRKLPESTIGSSLPVLFAIVVGRSDLGGMASEADLRHPEENFGLLAAPVISSRISRVTSRV